MYYIEANFDSSENILTISHRNTQGDYNAVRARVPLTCNTRFERGVGESILIFGGLSPTGGDRQYSLAYPGTQCYIDSSTQAFNSFAEFEAYFTTIKETACASTLGSVVSSGGAGNPLVSGSVIGNILRMVLTSGGTVDIDVTDMVNGVDVYVTSGVYNPGTANIDFTFSNASTVSVPVSALLTVTTGNSIDGDGASTPLTVGISSDLGNRIILGSDGKLYLTEVANANYFLSSTVLGASNTASPTLGEVSVYLDSESVTDRLVYYTGSATSTDTPLFLYWVDIDGSVVNLGTEVSLPAARGVTVFLSETTVDPTTAGQPVLSDIQALATANSYANQLLYYTGTDTATDPVVYIYDADESNTVTQITDRGVDLDGTGLLHWEPVVWDSVNSKFVRSPQSSDDTADTDIKMNSLSGNFYGALGTPRSDTTFDLVDIQTGGRAHIESNADSEPTFSHATATIVKLGDWSSSFTDTSSKYIKLIVVSPVADSEIIWAELIAAASSSSGGGGGSLVVPWTEHTGFPNATSATGTYASSVNTNGAIDLYGSGSDISGAGDQVIYWYSPTLIGTDATIELLGGIATEMETGTFNSGAGPYLMIRESATASGSKMIAVGTNPQNGRFQQKKRTATGSGVSESVDSPGGNYASDFGLRLVRTSGNIQAYYSQGGGAWVAIGPQYTDLSTGDLRIGIALDSHTGDDSKVTRIQGTLTITQ